MTFWTRLSMITLARGLQRSQCVYYWLLDVALLRWSTPGSRKTGSFSMLEEVHKLFLSPSGWMLSQLKKSGKCLLRLGSCVIWHTSGGSLQHNPTCSITLSPCSSSPAAQAGKKQGSRSLPPWIMIHYASFFSSCCSSSASVSSRSSFFCSPSSRASSLGVINLCVTFPSASTWLTIPPTG